MKTSVDLLQSEYHLVTLLRRRVLQWSLVWGACVVIALATWWLMQSRLSGARRAMEAAQCSYLPVEKLSQQNATMQRELRQLQAKGTVFGQLRDERPLLTLVGLASQAARQCNGRLVVRKMSFRRHEETPRDDGRQQKDRKGRQQEKAAKRDSPWATVSFNGDALDNLAVATFVVALRDSGVFRRVELQSSVESKAADTETRSYSLECDI